MSTDRCLALSSDGVGPDVGLPLDAPTSSFSILDGVAVGLSPSLCCPCTVGAKVGNSVSVGFNVGKPVTSSPTGALGGALPVGTLGGTFPTGALGGAPPVGTLGGTSPTGALGGKVGSPSGAMDGAKTASKVGDDVGLPVGGSLSGHALDTSKN
jgi:hypothetical protein